MLLLMGLMGIRRLIFSIRWEGRGEVVGAGGSVGSWDSCSRLGDGNVDGNDKSVRERMDLSLVLYTLSCLYRLEI